VFHELFADRFLSATQLQFATHAATHVTHVQTLVVTVTDVASADVVVSSSVTLDDTCDAASADVVVAEQTLVA
jgi:hypothetical protein